MNNLPDSVYVVLATGLTTIAAAVVTTIVTQFFLARAEAKKAVREDTREAKKQQTEWLSKQREIKALKLGELWLAVDLARERLADAGIQSQTGDQILPPPPKDSAASATSAAFSIALLHFPELRPLVYALHAETAKYETGLWFHRLEDEDAMLDRWSTIRTELADAVETASRNLQQH